MTAYGKNQRSTGLQGALALVYHVAGMGRNDQDETFEHLLKRAVALAKPEQGAIFQYSVRFEVIGIESVDVGLMAEKIRNHKLTDMTEDEMRFYIITQAQARSPPASGDEAAETFLENVEQQEEEGRVDIVDETDEE